ncbi:hypothetical protein F2Q69_00045342 [Brassica cretica]|uniref:Phytocyanin domain-containing protein n=1 Tax=Brassica cretica TaxID=69181 RepID=A0A8S9NMF0_BRACR|nr:hypothetical protein F2Q69_00045342 [Brassica cretica]
MGKTSTMLFLFYLCIIGISVITRCNATTYFVGDTSGWDISSDLESWTLGKRFSVGDVLSNGPSLAPVGAPGAAPVGILQPSSKKNNPATGVASSAARVGGYGGRVSIGTFVYLMVFAFPLLWTYISSNN